MADTVVVTAPDANAGVLSPTLSDAVAAAQIYSRNAQAADADAEIAKSAAIQAELAALNSASSAAASAALAAEYAAEAHGGTAITTTILADLVSENNVAVPKPNLPNGGTGFFIVDGIQVPDGGRVLLVNQNAPADNGVWQYTFGTNTLSRPSDFLASTAIRQPFNVVVGDDGTKYGGTTWALASPVSAIIGQTATSWQLADTGAGLLASGTTILGPYQPASGPKPGSARRLTPMDEPWYWATPDSSRGYAQSIYWNLNREGVVSQTTDPISPDDTTSVLNRLLARYTSVDIDCPIYLNNQVTIPPGRRIRFCGSGRYGPAKIYQRNAGASVFNLDGSFDVSFEGLMVIEYIWRATAAVKAIKTGSNGVKRLRIDAVETKGVDYAINFAGPLDDIWIGSVGVDNIATDIPLFIAQSGTTGQESVRVQRVRNQPNVTTVTNANKAYTPHIDGRVLVYSGAMTANRAVTLATNNRIGSGEFRVSHQATGGFSIDALGLKTLTNGQTAHVGFTGDGVATLLG